MSERHSKCGCGCDAGCGRRDFLTAMSTAVGSLAFTSLAADAAEEETAAAPVEKAGASIRAVFLYPPSKTFADNPDGWWSWPGNSFDAEGRQKQYTAALSEMEKRLGMKIEEPVGRRWRSSKSKLSGSRWLKEITQLKPPLSTWICALPPPRPRRTRRPSRRSSG